MAMYSWFKIEAGKPPYAGQFRLITPSTGMALISRTRDVAPYLWNHPSKEVFPDQYFSFVFEDMTVVDIDYKLKLGKIVSSTPLLIADQTNQNDSPTQQLMTFKVSESVTRTGTFQYGSGLTITAGMKFEGMSVSPSFVASFIELLLQYLRCP